MYEDSIVLTLDHPRREEVAPRPVEEEVEEEVTRPWFVLTVGLATIFLYLLTGSKKWAKR